jgi:hypothetical protein
MNTTITARDLERQTGEPAADWQRRLKRLRVGDLDIGAFGAFERLLHEAEEAARRESGLRHRPLPPHG